MVTKKGEEEITLFSRGSIYVGIIFTSSTYCVRTCVLAHAAVQS